MDFTTNENASYKAGGSRVWTSKRLKKIFYDMKARCYNVNKKDYRWYGAHGIKVCDEWLNNPRLFVAWAMANGYTDNLTIDRIDEEKDYCPENCQWITAKENSKYKSTTSLIEVDGVSHTGRDWSGLLGFGPNLINTYIRVYGLTNTIEFIRRYMAHPGIKPDFGQSYYNVYMVE